MRDHHISITLCYYYLLALYSSFSFSPTHPFFLLAIYHLLQLPRCSAPHSCPPTTEYIHPSIHPSIHHTYIPNPFQHSLLPLSPSSKTLLFCACYIILLIDIVCLIDANRFASGFPRRPSLYSVATPPFASLTFTTSGYPCRLPILPLLNEI